MIRRERWEDHSQTVWTDRVVSEFGPDGDLLSTRPLTDAEAAEFQAWAATQRGNATRLRHPVDAAPQTARRALEDAD